MIWHPAWFFFFRRELPWVWPLGATRRRRRNAHVVCIGATRRRRGAARLVCIDDRAASQPICLCHPPCLHCQPTCLCQPSCPSHPAWLYQPDCLSQSAGLAQPASLRPAGTRCPGRDDRNPHVKPADLPLSAVMSFSPSLSPSAGLSQPADRSFPTVVASPSRGAIHPG